MNILKALQEVRQITHKRSQGVIYQIADVKEAVSKLCDVVEAAYEETDPASRQFTEGLQNWVSKERTYSNDTIRKGLVEGDGRRWTLCEHGSGPILRRVAGRGRIGEEVEVMPVEEHERLMDVLRCVVRDNDRVLGQVQSERDALLRAIQSVQMCLWPSDTERFGESKEAPFEDLDNFVSTIRDQIYRWRENLKDVQQQREEMRRAMLAQRQRPPAPDLYVGRGRYEAAVADRGILQDKLRDVWNLAHALAEGLRLTQEYIGDEKLPPETGWSWYDALMKYHAAMGVGPDNFINLGRADQGADMVEDCGDEECS